MADEKTVAEQIAEAVKAAETGLKSKNKELLGKLKKATDIVASFDGVDIEALKKNAADLEALNKNKQKESGEYKTLYDEQSTQHKEAIGTINTELTDTKATLANERKANALTQALVANHIKPELVGASTDILTNQVAINDEGVAMVGDKTVTEYVKDWSLGDVGKHFTTTANSGGGAGGQGGSQATQASFYDPNSPSFSRTEQAKVANTNLALHQSLTKSAPMMKRD